MNINEDKYNQCINDIGDLVQKTSRIFQLMERDNVIQSKYTTSQSYLLIELLNSYENELTVNDIVAKMKLEKSSVTRLVDGLVKNKLVKRIRNSEDKRVVKAKLTTEGTSVAKSIKENRLEYYKSIIKKLPKGHVREVMSSFDIVITAFENSLKSK